MLQTYVNECLLQAVEKVGNSEACYKEHTFSDSLGQKKIAKGILRMWSINQVYYTNPERTDYSLTQKSYLRVKKLIDLPNIYKVRNIKFYLTSGGSLRKMQFLTHDLKEISYFGVEGVEGLSSYWFYLQPDEILNPQSLAEEIISFMVKGRDNYQRGELTTLQFNSSTPRVLNLREWLIILRFLYSFLVWTKKSCSRNWRSRRTAVTLGFGKRGRLSKNSSSSLTTRPR